MAPDIGTGIGNSICQDPGISALRYWTTHLFDEANLTLRATGRNGLSLPASIGTSPTLLLPYYKMLTANGIARVADNGALDIGANQGFTYCGFADCTDVSAVSYKVIGGKWIRGGTVPNGWYGIRVAATSCLLTFYAKSTGTAITVSTETDSRTLGMFFYLIDINQATGKARFFIWTIGGELTQVGADISFTGTFPALDNKYQFGLSVGNNGDTGAAYDAGKIHHSDTWVIKKILSPTEMADLRNNHYSATIAKSDVLAYWPCNTVCDSPASISELLYDVSGNDHHLTVSDVNGLQATNGYSSSGSKWNLLKGFTLCKNLSLAKSKHISIPADYDGSPLSAPTLFGGFTREYDVVGNSNYFNFTNALVEFAVGSTWDRSNATIWNAYARDATNGFYDLNNPTRWHSTELTQDNIDYCLNDDYKDVHVLNAVTNSNNQRTYLKEIYSWVTAKSDLNLKKVLYYTNDYGSMFNHFTREGSSVVTGNSWHPSSVYLNGKTYIAFQGNDLDPYLITYTHATKAWSVPVKVGTNPLPNTDPGHGYPSMVIDNLGYIHVFWGAHYTDVQYAKSTNPLDITTWTAKSSPANGTYFQPIQLSDGVIKLFYRFQNPAIDGYKWGYVASADNGDTWGAFVENFREFGYMRFIQGVGDVIHVSGEATNTTGYDRMHLYYAMWYDGKWHKDDGTELNIPIVQSVTDIKIYDTGELAVVKSICAFDANNNPCIGFAVGNNTPLGIGDHVYKFIKWDGASWDLTDLAVSTRMNNNGVPVVIVNTDGSIEYYLNTSKNEAYLGGNLEKYISNDGGVTFAFDSIVIYGNMILPTLVKDAHPDAKIVCGDYFYSETEWACKGYLYGNNGLIKNYKGSNW